jgi:hypothetical protein
VPLLPPGHHVAHPDMLNRLSRQSPLPQQQPHLSRESMTLPSIAQIRDFGSVAHRSGINTSQGAIDVSASEKSNQSTQPSHQLHSLQYHEHSQQSTDSTGTTHFEESRNRYTSGNVAASSWVFDLPNAFGGQESTAAALYQWSTITSSRLLKLHGCYNSGRATLYPHDPSCPAIHESMPASSMTPAAWTNADYAANSITQNERWNASLDLSHDCSSLCGDESDWASM